MDRGIGLFAATVLDSIGSCCLLAGVWGGDWILAMIGLAVTGLGVALMLMNGEVKWALLVSILTIGAVALVAIGQTYLGVILGGLSIFTAWRVFLGHLMERTRGR